MRRLRDLHGTVLSMKSPMSHYFVPFTWSSEEVRGPGRRCRNVVSVQIHLWSPFQKRGVGFSNTLFLETCMSDMRWSSAYPPNVINSGIRGSSYVVPAFLHT